jgi:hypothetical protein
LCSSDSTVTVMLWSDSDANKSLWILAINTIYFRL